MRKKIKVKAIEYNPICEPKSMHGYRGVRWIENVSRGLRFVGYADDIARLNHKGWYIRDEDYGEVYRGVVYQLPARHGLPQYVYGYADPCNDDCALICFDVEADKADAARAADRFAEIFAEHERDYDRAASAKQHYDDLADEVKRLRAEALAVGRGMRADLDMDAACERVCRDKIKSCYRAIQQARKERAELLDRFNNAPGWEE
jgi:hypothetical protein